MGQSVASLVVNFWGNGLFKVLDFILFLLEVAWMNTEYWFEQISGKCVILWSRMRIPTHWSLINFEVHWVRMSLIRYFSLDNKSPFHDPLFHLYSGCSAKFAAGLYWTALFVLFDVFVCQLERFLLVMTKPDTVVMVGFQSWYRHALLLSILHVVSL